MRNLFNILSVAVFLVTLPVRLFAVQVGDNDYAIVEALKWNKKNPQSEKWHDYKARLVKNLPKFEASFDLTNAYGSLKEDKAPFKATGFFYVTQRNGRWVMVDPEGYMHLNTVVVGIRKGKGERNMKAFGEKFSSDLDWISKTSKLLHETGFSGAGTWSDDKMIQQYNASHPEEVLTYCPMLSLMAGYGKYKKVTFQMSGHVGFPNQCIPVFDPEFKTYCENVLPKLLAPYLTDKNVVGFFSDNELPFGLKNLEGYLKLPDSDRGHIEAVKWLERKGIDSKHITDVERAEFAGIVAERYFRIVAEALKKADSNHMYLGARIHGGAKKVREIQEAAGRYCDVVSMNYYGAWEISKKELDDWNEWMKKPFIITEFYTKAEDSGLGNKTGAGWLVHTQKDRGFHYENFTLRLLESGNCVGWHWFKYQDNDPSAKGVDPSNIDSNKGLFNNDYVYYSDLQRSMMTVNRSKYQLLYYFVSFLN